MDKNQILLQFKNVENENNKFDEVGGSGEYEADKVEDINHKCDFEQMFDDDEDNRIYLISQVNPIFRESYCSTFKKFCPKPQISRTRQHSIVRN